ncbi:DUF4214 domain-containing protein [Sphingobium cupriresistens]|uniref:Glycosyl transferase n=1 Tax=Sphingobium cupriresistens LL01 TaxID=1420583 RepID=A0A0J7Y5P7_9SPHN|nr:DUF4214 domain-containing protein [Sphingobium cupriresistens]KMS58713.1 hypothetical protein V473_03155 [Sphingobium cupriresistens LL01]
MNLDIIIPVYRNADLVEACLDSLNAHVAEVADHAPRVIVINDSPDDQVVAALLAKYAKRGLIHELVTNQENVGFVKSVNKGLALAQDRAAAALLVNSDTLTYKNTLAEMLAVLQADPQIGFVCPRSNNASISTFPQSPHAMSGVFVMPDACYAAWRSVQSFLPRYSWAPTAVGFYMLIAPSVVANFAPLDEAFGVGYEEENDLVMRAGKVGFRAVMANHAYAYHAGSASFLLRDIDLKGQREGNLQKIAARHPEFLPLVRSYEASAGYRAELKLRQLVPNVDGKLKIAINLLTFGRHHNGTTDHMMNFIRWCERAAPNDVEIHAICEPSIARFHGIDKMQRIKQRRECDPIYAVAIMPGQPFDLQTVRTMEHLAPVTLYGMLDVIALDCSHMRAENGLDALWAYVARHANGLFFNSRFSETTFRNRFPRQFTVPAYTRLLPTKLAAYAGRYQKVDRARDHVLVMGNHFPHKASQEIGALIAQAHPNLAITILGGDSRVDGNARTVQAGTLPDEQMNDLFARSSAVVLPSYYEGFGLSIMNALALGKPVIARDIAPTREILATFGATSGIFLFTDNRDVPALIGKAISAEQSKVEEKSGGNWDQWSKGLFDFAMELAKSPDLHDRLVGRIEAADALHGATSAFTSTSSEYAADSALGLRSDGAVVRIADLLQLDSDAFVQAAYRQLLGRPVDPSGLEHHIALLNSGTTKAQIIEAFLETEEFRERRTPVSVVGRELLRKSRWPKGLRFPQIKNEAAAKNEPGAVIDAAPPPSVQPQWPVIAPPPAPSQQVSAASHKAVVRIADLLALDAADFVDAFYRRLLGREADAAGFDHHIALLGSGTSKADILRSILKSGEFERNSDAVSVEGMELLAPENNSRRRRKTAPSRSPTPSVAEKAPAVPAPLAPVHPGKPVIQIGDMLALDNDTFVRTFYDQLLGRAADPAGLSHHLALLERGETKAGILRSILQSGEYQERASSVIVAGREHLEPQRKGGWPAKLHKIVKP